MSVGSFVLMLHSHLPYYRKAGMWPFGEESFYECMAETYIPLLNAIDDLVREGIQPKLTVGITPILCEQMSDEHLNRGFETFIEGRIEAAVADELRFSPRGESPNQQFCHLARFYRNWFEGILSDYRKRWGKDIVGAFRRFQDAGAIEITTSAATHCFSPLLETDASLKLQFQTGVESYKRHFGCQPRGIWLPECAYRPKQDKRPGLEKWLYEAGLKYFFTESFVIEGGSSVEERREFGPYGSIENIPVKAKPQTGFNTFEAFYLKDYPVAVLGRHEQAGFQVWSAEHGYPGDGNYREFHKKDDVSGLHYWRLTSKQTDLADKKIYNPEAAGKRLQENSEHYVGVVQKALIDHLKATGETGLVMVSFDTELFGHWWFEGISWIKEIIRKFHKYTNVSVQTASEYLETKPPEKGIDLPESSWGQGGHWQVWLNEDTEWMWPIIHDAEHRMESLTAKYKQGNGDPVGRALSQATRELLLLQSSDWPFLVTTGQAKDYAIERFNGHKDRFFTLTDMIESGNIDEGKLKEIEDVDNCFPDVNYKNLLIEES